MRGQGYPPSWLVRCCFIACLLVTCIFFCSSSARAQVVSAPVANVSLNVSIGFSSLPYNMYRINKWTPVQVEMTNRGEAFRGKLSVSTQIGTFDGSKSGVNRSPWKFETPVTLPKASQQRITLYAPFYYDTIVSPGIIASLVDSQGKIVATRAANSQLEIKPGNVLVGLLTDPANHFDILNTLLLPNQSNITEVNLNPGNMPDTASVLDNFDIILIDNFDSKTLRPGQILALETWVNRGGTLIESAGTQWQRTLGALPAALVPVHMNTTITLPAGTQLIPANDPVLQSSNQENLNSLLPASIAMTSATTSNQNSFENSETVLSTGSIPLFVQANQGQGTICYLAVDMADPHLQLWPGLTNFWMNIFLHALGDQSLQTSISENYPTGPGQILTRMGILDMLRPGALPGPFILLLFLLGYAIMLGPGRILIARKFRQPHVWRWRIFVTSILVFSLFAYALASYQRVASITNNAITLVQMNQEGNSAHLTTYAGIFVPNQGNFTLQIPGQSLAQPIPTQFTTGNGDPQSRENTNATISNSNAETTLSLNNPPPWTLHYTITEQDTHFSGKLTAEVSLLQNNLVGTIKNTLPTALNDVSLLLPHHVAFIGHIAAGDTIHISAPLYDISKPMGQTLADAIEKHNGLSPSYFPYTNNNQPQTDQQRHMALLSALEGVGYNFPPCQGPCRIHAVTAHDTIFVTGGRVPNPNMNTYEPLLLDNAPATLIGWTDQPLTSNITINGWYPLSHQDTFVQMPINVNMTGALNIPPDILPGQLIDLQSYDAEQALSGIYTMTYGSMTFEMRLPALAYPLTHGINIYQPDLWANPFGPGMPVNTSHMQSQLYNWQKGSWDTVTFKDDIYHTNNIQDYVGPDGRVLLQVSNQDENMGKLYFGKPSLSIQT